MTLSSVYYQVLNVSCVCVSVSMRTLCEPDLQDRSDFLSQLTLPFGFDLKILHLTTAYQLLDIFINKYVDTAYQLLDIFINKYVDTGCPKKNVAMFQTAITTSKFSLGKKGG